MAKEMIDGVDFKDILKESLDEPIGLKLKKWCKKNEGEIEKAFLTWIDSQLRFIIVRKEMLFDYDFETGMYDFQAQMCHEEDTKGIDIDFMCLPQCSMEGASTFLGRNFIEIKF